MSDCKEVGYMIDNKTRAHSMQNEKYSKIISGTKRDFDEEKKTYFLNGPGVGREQPPGKART